MGILPHPQTPSPWRLCGTQLISHVLSTFVITAFLGTAFTQDFLNYIKSEYLFKPSSRTDHPDKVATALPSEDVKTPDVPSDVDTRVPCWEVGLYANWHGYECEEFETLSDDGFVLVVERVWKKGFGPGMYLFRKKKGRRFLPRRGCYTISSHIFGFLDLSKQIPVKNRYC